jgi:hypothetical protein
MEDDAVTLALERDLSPVLDCHLLPQLGRNDDLPLAADLRVMELLHEEILSSGKACYEM